MNFPAIAWPPSSIIHTLSTPMGLYERGNLIPMFASGGMKEPCASAQLAATSIVAVPVGTGTKKLSTQDVPNISKSLLFYYSAYCTS